MKYNYWADGDYSVYRLPEGASTSGPAEVFQWTPWSGVRAAASATCSRGKLIPCLRLRLSECAT